MVSQLRIYTINRGMMDSWLKLFEEQIRPIHSSIGIPVESTWVNADRTEFLWVRSFDSVEAIPQKEAEYFASDGRKALILLDGGARQAGPGAKFQPGHHQAVSGQLAGDGGATWSHSYVSTPSTGE